jgi:hypothetical protein
MDWYENIEFKEYKIYYDIIDLFKNEPKISTQKNTIIFMKNSMSGFGSQLTIFSQNSHYVYTHINPNIICIPHYSENNKQFKYHDERFKNSFFIYFKFIDSYKNILNNTDINDWNIYFCQSIFWIPNHPFFDRTSFNDFYSNNNNTFYEHFKSKFKLNIDINNIINTYKIQYSNLPPSDILYKKKLIGIHLRSKYHSLAEYSQFGNFDIKNILIKLKYRFDKYYNENYCIFVATDVRTYIDYCKEIFNDNGNIQKLYYIPEINRIDSENFDSIPLLEDNKGAKLGFDILMECKTLSICDELWLSTSNITCILEFIGRKACDDDIHWLYGNI